MKNNLKRLVALGRVKPITQVLENGDIAVIAFERKSKLSRKKQRYYVLPQPIVMNMGIDKATTDENKNEVSNETGKQDNPKGHGVTACDFGAGETSVPKN